MNYLRVASPLHATRAAVGCAYCGALILVAVVYDNPVVLAAVVLVVLCAAAAAGVSREVGRAARLAVPLALIFAAINPLVSHNGLTVIARLGDLPLVGHTDVTVENAVYGGVIGLRVLAICLACALYVAAVDPDEVLDLFRRVGFRSALTAALATRMFPVLARDARRLADAQRCRPGGSASRLALLRAVTAGALDRAVDVAATLELRGYGTGAARTAGLRQPWSRHDIAFTAAAALIAGATIAARVGGALPFHAYPRLSLPLGAGTAALCAGLLICALAPFVDRRGIVT
ncbi:MAG TPA: energy-coupling factor transporter transmembrane component T [Solirubrobacteraceae bacterium]|nr:energy-coupling factor transporter transmembrane component T [Solirubrobacteraceae bacterium]